MFREANQNKLKKNESKVGIFLKLKNSFEKIWRKGKKKLEKCLKMEKSCKCWKKLGKK